MGTRGPVFFDSIYEKALCLVLGSMYNIEVFDKYLKLNFAQNVNSFTVNLDSNGASSKSSLQLKVNNDTFSSHLHSFAKNNGNKNSQPNSILAMIVLIEFSSCMYLHWFRSRNLYKLTQEYKLT